MSLRLLLALLLPALATAVFDTSGDCEWDCQELDGQALQTFSKYSGPSGFKIELARLDLQTGDYVSLANYPSLALINAAVFWRDNVTYPGVTMDKLFAVERTELPTGIGSQTVEKNYLVQLCPQNDTFFRRAVLHDNTGYYVASASNDGIMWASGGGINSVVNINFTEIAQTNLASISHDDDETTYPQFNIDAGGYTVNDLAWYEPCKTFIGLSKRGSDVSDTAVMLFDYETQSTQSFTFADGIDGPQGRHKGFGACYSFDEGNAVMCSGNGDSNVEGGLYQIDMDPDACEPRKVSFRVDTQKTGSNDGTSCRFPGTLPCIPAFVEASNADQCGLQRVMGANSASAGGSGAWTQVAGDIAVVFSDTSDPSAAVTAPEAGYALLRWTLSAPLCSDAQADITVNFGVGCCLEDQYVNNNVCTPCTPPYIRPAGDDPMGMTTQCVWPVCPDLSVYVNGSCRCITGFANDPVWNGVIWTNTCKKICKFCSANS